MNICNILPPEVFSVAHMRQISCYIYKLGRRDAAGEFKTFPSVSWDSHPVSFLRFTLSA